MATRAASVCGAVSKSSIGAGFAPCGTAVNEWPLAPIDVAANAVARDGNRYTLPPRAPAPFIALIIPKGVGAPSPYRNSLYIPNVSCRSRSRASANACSV